MTLTQKTYLFLQNAKITITEVPLLVYSDTICHTGQGNEKKFQQ